MEWEEVKVFDHPSQMEKISDKSFDEIRARIIANKIGTAIFKTPSDFIYFVSNPSMKLVNELSKHGKINIIYSQWEGYLKDKHKQYFTDNINALKKRAILFIIQFIPEETLADILTHHSNKKLN